MILNLENDLAAALRSPEVIESLEDLIRRIVDEAIQNSPLLDELLDVHGAAQVLGVTASAIWKASEEGRLPTVRHGRRLRFRRRDLLNPAKASSR